MTESEWLECADPSKMLAFLQDKASDRLFGLFACACARLGHGPSPILDIAEQYADKGRQQEDLSLPDRFGRSDSALLSALSVEPAFRSAVLAEQCAIPGVVARIKRKTFPVRKPPAVQQPAPYKITTQTIPDPDEKLGNAAWDSALREGLDYLRTSPPRSSTDRSIVRRAWDEGLIAAQQFIQDLRARGACAWRNELRLIDEGKKAIEHAAAQIDPVWGEYHVKNMVKTLLRLLDDALARARAAAEAPTIKAIARQIEERSLRLVNVEDEIREYLASLLRCIFGNPFRPGSIDPLWLTPDLASLAQVAYETSASPAGELEGLCLCAIADRLEEIGCTNVAILGHLRDSGPHVRWCWAVALLLRKP